MGVNVAFEIDANGILKVTATDFLSGKNKSIIVKSSGGLSDAEVERMVDEAERMLQKNSRQTSSSMCHSFPSKCKFGCLKSSTRRRPAPMWAQQAFWHPDLPCP